MKLILTDDEKRQVQDGVRRVLAGEKKWDAPDLHFPSTAIIRAVAEIEGIVDTEDFRTNGWQWDWWQDFEFEGTRFTLSGSGAYGGHAFFVADEQ